MILRRWPLLPGHLPPQRRHLVAMSVGGENVKSNHRWEALRPHWDFLSTSSSPRLFSATPPLLLTLYGVIGRTVMRRRVRGGICDYEG